MSHDDAISRIEAAVSTEYGNWRVTIYSSLAQDIRTLLDRCRAAERRVEHWKAEHLAGNAEIERLREVLQELIESRDVYNGSETDAQLRDNVARLRRAEAAARAALENTDGK